MKNVVSVYVGSEPGLTQPDSFRCCPLGAQFYSDKELAPYEMMEFKLQVPADSDFTMDGPMTCAGVVVHCQKDAAQNRFRVWLMFLDLPETTRSQLQCFGKSGGHLCPYCENF